MSLNLSQSVGGVITNELRLHALAVPQATELLTNGNEAEVLAFLAERPLHTVCMASMILDNGLQSPLNRGSFYAYRDAIGKLQGVALIGHATLLDTRTDAALEAFAHLAKENPRAHLIRGEQEMIERFLTFFTPTECLPHLVYREMLLELQQQPGIQADEIMKHLRPVTLDDLDLVMTVNAKMIFEECKVNPLESDLEGFRRRTARRIEQERVWAWIENGRMVFKTEIMSMSPQVIYLEGVYVDPEMRSKGFGFRCFSQLSRHLQGLASSICLLVNENNPTAINLYLRSGYQLRSTYDTIYLRRKST